MRLANGIVLDKDTTFGELKFSALRREVRIQNEDGSVSDEIKERTYDPITPSKDLSFFILFFNSNIKSLILFSLFKFTYGLFIIISPS